MAAEALREAFLNLVALKAMPAGGRFPLPIRHRGRPRRGPGRGSSMSEETRRRVFEPFFTTKRAQGNGLGLAVVRDTVTCPPDQRVLPVEDNPEILRSLIDLLREAAIR